MKNHVTAETALKLKNAGFPQPTPESGQLWYQHPVFNNVWQCVSGVDNQGTTPDVIFESGRFVEGKKLVAQYTYAPTAPDILQELGSDYCIKADNSGFECILGSRISRNPEAWAHSSSQSVSFLLRYHHENPAEACAQAWLAKKSKERAFVQRL